MGAVWPDVAGLSGGTALDGGGVTKIRWAVWTVVVPLVVGWPLLDLSNSSYNNQFLVGMFAIPALSVGWLVMGLGFGLVVLMEERGRVIPQAAATVVAAGGWLWSATAAGFCVVGLVQAPDPWRPLTAVLGAAVVGAGAAWSAYRRWPTEVVEPPFGAGRRGGVRELAGSVPEAAVASLLMPFAGGLGLAWVLGLG